MTRSLRAFGNSSTIVVCPECDKVMNCANERKAKLLMRLHAKKAHNKGAKIKETTKNILSLTETKYKNEHDKMRVEYLKKRSEEVKEFWN